MFPIRTILHATDFTTLSDHAFQMAAALGRDQGARIVVLHVAPMIIPSFDMMIGSLPPTEEEEKRLMEKLRSIGASEDRLNVAHRLEFGEPADVVLRVADEEKCDLIVLGTHGRSGLGRLLMGSTAEQVVRHAECPVLTVRHPVKGAEVEGPAECQVAATTA